MTIEKERERKAFEVWFESRYDAHFMQFALDLDFYVDKHTQTCWESWLSSANREGYKLVPKYHQENIKDALIIACDIKEDEQRFEDSLNYVHEAMIGACDE